MWDIGVTREQPITNWEPVREYFCVLCDDTPTLIEMHEDT